MRVLILICGSFTPAITELVYLGPPLHRTPPTELSNSPNATAIPPAEPACGKSILLALYFLPVESLFQLPGLLVIDTRAYPVYTISVPPPAEVGATVNRAR